MHRWRTQSIFAIAHSKLASIARAERIDHGSVAA